MTRTIAALGGIAVFACATANAAAETGRTDAFVMYSEMLIDHVVSKYRARLRIAAALKACEQESLSDKVWISAEARVREVKAYILSNTEAASLGDQPGLTIGRAYYRSGVVDTARAYLLGKSQDKDNFCASIMDAAKLLQAP